MAENKMRAHALSEALNECGYDIISYDSIVVPVFDTEKNISCKRAAIKLLLFPREPMNTGRIEEADQS